MVEEEREFKVGHVFVDGEEIEYESPGIPGEIAWIHVAPWEYDHEHLKKSKVFCFTNTVKGGAAMKEWLKGNCLWRMFEYGNSIHDKIVEYIKTPAYTNNKDQVITEAITSVYDVTQAFLDTLGEHAIDPSDPDLLEKLNEPALLLKGSLTHCSVVYDADNYGPPTDTDHMMRLNDPTTLPDLDTPLPPYHLWKRKISSAQVQEGCLRLFDGLGYGGQHLFLWGPNGKYPYLSDFGFNNRALSLQQA